MYIVVLTIISILIAWIFFQSREREQERTENFKKMAEKNGYSYKETSPGFIRRLRRFKFFSQGQNRRVANVITGNFGDFEFKVADYSFATGFSHSAQAHFYTICLIHDHTMNLPHFFLRHEDNPYDYLGKLFGGQDINFAEDPAFSEAFVLQGDDEIDLKYLFNAKTRKIMMKYAGSCSQLEGVGNTLMLHRGGGVWAATVPALIEEAAEICRHLKRTVEIEGLDRR
ncbi:MAG: hypothetical protein PHD82_00425 [Candidatus Riflebacteria bacterium]|nr:hypothetical protein [Candidatus Riflebacteria bacterium]